MDSEARKVLEYLCKRYHGKQSLSDLFHTFQFCSRYDDNKRCLIDSQTKTINYDRLTNWISGVNPVQSADSLSFTDDFLYFIEFKSGDQIEKPTKAKKLITNVSGKINDSERTVFTQILPNIEGIQPDLVKLRFYLVVDTKALGVDASVIVLAKLSLGAELTKEPKIQRMFSEVLPNLKENLTHPDNYDDVDIWFSELFDTHLAKHGIKDIEEYLNAASSAT